jgi:di/tricarboxylate transporter
VVDTFSGFGHPAVITVAAVLIISRGLSNSGAVELMARRIVPTRGGPTLLLLSLCLVSAGLSAFMNNIGALALLMPVALQAARRNNLSPAILLMPLSFASLLGGMTTLIGTPPNIIIAGFRSRTADAPFGMFDFTPVGIAVALSGGAFVALVGWRLLPRKRRGAKAPQELLEIAPYVTELRVKEKAKVAGRMIGEIEDELSEAEVQILGLIRGERRILVPGRRRIVQSGDLLVVESQPEPLAKLAASHGLELAGVGKLEPSALQAGDIVLMEAVVRPDSLLAGLTVGSIDLHARYNVNLLGVSRQGRHRHQRLTDFRFEPGDVLLLQGDQTRLGDFVSAFGCAPLAERQLQIVKRFQPIQAVGALLVAVVAVAAGILPAEIALSAAALAIVLMGIVPIRRVYESIDWSIIVLLAALIPVAGAIEASGAADLIARSLIAGLASGSAVIGLVIVMVVTMMLTDVMNNSATAAVMAPIAIGVAARLGVSADPFLMAVAIGASCAFLTPIGHQNNTLILGPGGYRFTDFWRMGLPLEIVVVAVSIPMLLYVWPF